MTTFRHYDTLLSNLTREFHAGQESPTELMIRIASIEVLKHHESCIMAPLNSTGPVSTDVDGNYRS